jgi:two-component system sensor histidine kinase/response regulator
MQGDREAALEAGMDGFLPKPVTADSLVRAVSQAAERSESAPPSAAVATADDEVPALDGKVFRSLLAGSGSTERAGMLADLFDRESQGVVAELRDALAEGDASRVAKAAHSLKGSSSTLGAKRVASLAADMERAGREERLPDAATLMERLEPAVAGATAALHAAAAAA